MVSMNDPSIVLYLSSPKACLSNYHNSNVPFSIMQLSQTVNYPGAGRPGLFAGCDNDMLCWAENEQGRSMGSCADVRQSFKKKKDPGN